MSFIQRTFGNSAIGSRLNSKLANLDMTVGQALEAIYDLNPKVNDLYLKNPLPMFYPYSTTGHKESKRLLDIVGSHGDYRNPRSVGVEGINDTWDAVLKGYRSHSTRNMGVVDTARAKGFTTEQGQGLGINTPILMGRRNGSGELLLAMTPNRPSNNPWVEGGVTSRIAAGSTLRPEQRTNFVDIDDPANFDKWSRLENWSPEFTDPYFHKSMKGQIQIGMPFKVVKELGVSPYEVRQGQVIATPVARPVILNSQPQVAPNPQPSMSAIEADFWKQISQFNPDLDAPFVSRVDANGQPSSNWVPPKSRRMASDVLEPLGERLPRGGSDDLGQQYLAMQETMKTRQALQSLAAFANQYDIPY